MTFVCVICKDRFGSAEESANHYDKKHWVEDN